MRIFEIADAEAQLALWKLVNAGELDAAMEAASSNTLIL